MSRKNYNCKKSKDYVKGSIQPRVQALVETKESHESFTIVNKHSLSRKIDFINEEQKNRLVALVKEIKKKRNRKVQRTQVIEKQQQEEERNAISGVEKVSELHYFIIKQIRNQIIDVYREEDYVNKLQNCIIKKAKICIKEFMNLFYQSVVFTHHNQIKKANTYCMINYEKIRKESLYQMDKFDSFVTQVLNFMIILYNMLNFETEEVEISVKGEYEILLLQGKLDIMIKKQLDVGKNVLDSLLKNSQYEGRTLDQIPPGENLDSLLILQ